MSVPLYVPSGEGEFVNIRDTKRTYLKLTHQESDGGASPHIHAKSTEMFYVVKGEIEFTIGDKIVVGEPGAFAYVPKGAPHGFTNRGKEDATLLIMFYPVFNREDYFRGPGRLTANGRNPSLEELQEHMAKYDQVMV
ncbi:mannose-6-phosphate isomerase-like protein (cupin superfamily) [Kitasatospora sp. MAA4]|uniref:cupin domain-containing protein n=1 Tax=Kitasatospora sp. MAA4 TaxID=3035093 RepID=UPI0024768A75|nr:cupin domain-containing protein [Kitasatospora sp. MAA4]MDH6132755.1 mannose-6-phosphate isomerase-like protein (cupin superfamily) [Kitasatospora sp. MAA4]